MKGIKAYYLLKYKGLIHKEMSYRYLKFLKRIFGINRWDDFVRHIMMLHYLNPENDLSEPIRVPEVNFQIGGHMVVDMRGGNNG